MTAQDIITLVRQELNDTFAEQYRFSNPEALSALTDAVRKLAQDRPDLLLKSDGTYNTVADMTAVGDTIIFSDYERQPLMHYTCYRLLSKDSEDNQNLALAGAHLTQYNNKT